VVDGLKRSRLFLRRRGLFIQTIGTLTSRGGEWGKKGKWVLERQKLLSGIKKPIKGGLTTRGKPCAAKNGKDMGEKGKGNS